MHGFRTVRPPQDHAVQSEINVTPFIDVVLVLLIVFMVAAPLSTVSVPLELPSARATPLPAPDKPLIVSVQSDLSVHLNDQPIGGTALADALREAGATADSRVLLRADKRIAYGDLMGVLNHLRTSGFSKVALVGLEAER